MNIVQWFGSLPEKLSWGTTTETTSIDTEGFLLSDRINWDDFYFNATNLRINPSTSKPDFDYLTGRYLFDGSSTETVVGQKITEHRFKINSAEWHPHIHWVQAAAGNVVWQLEYQIWPAGQTEPAFTTILSNAVVFAYTSGTIHQISTFPAIDMSALSSVAAQVTVRVSRLGANAGDTYSGDAAFFGFDFHVPVDAFGSKNELTKNGD